MGILYDTVVHSVEDRVEEFIKHVKEKTDSKQDKHPKAYSDELSDIDEAAIREAVIKAK